ncbi:HpcH/HpaI aldolase/citrate lyase family protein [Pseudophaeobacter sp.]|uniref:HpcH/HpaI aldolase/citrate lyase family protein n=1 Tax=Pseudophaeobacter sp. TaxID=1971739 RepID=UPI0040588060
MTDLTSARSFLFVPGDRPERFGKAAASGAHAIIIDLEDAVAPEAKMKARHHAKKFLDQVAVEKVLVRINGIESAFFEADLALSNHPSLSGVILPKADAESCSKVVQKLENPVWPLIETVRGLVDLREIVSLSDLGRLLLGTIDLSLDLGLEMDHPGGQTALDAARFMLVTNSRLGDLPPPIDGVFTNLDDTTGLQNATEHACASGMGGMMCIHPRQTSVVHAAFAPSEAEVEWAQAVVLASEGQKGSFQFRGKMVDKPVLDRAQGTLVALQDHRP